MIDLTFFFTVIRAVNGFYLIYTGTKTDKNCTLGSNKQCGTCWQSDINNYNEGCTGMVTLTFKQTYIL